MWNGTSSSSNILGRNGTQDGPEDDPIWVYNLQWSMLSVFFKDIKKFL